MKVQTTLFLFAILTVLTDMTGGRTCDAQTRPASAQSQTDPAAASGQTSTSNAHVVHIELNTQRYCTEGDCPFHLTAANFSISVNGRLYPVRVTPLSRKSPGAGPEFPTHLLAVFPRDTSRPDEASVVDNFSRVLSRGWLVSVNRADGSFTPYCADTASLKAALEAMPAAPTADSKVLPELQQATATLTTFAGHRVLILDGNGSAATPSEGWVAPLVRAGVQVYLVDGGRRVPVWYDTSWKSAGGKTPQSGDYVPKMRRFDEDGILHEVTLAATLKDCLKDYRYDYDLEFELPESQSEPTSPITLAVLRVKDFIPYDPRPDLYRVTEQTVDGKPVSARVTLQQKLRFEINDCGNPQIPCPAPWRHPK